MVTLDGNGFLVEIEWQNGEADTLWVERLLKNVPRKPWGESELEVAGHVTAKENPGKQMRAPMPVFQPAQL